MIDKHGRMTARKQEGAWITFIRLSIF